MRTKFITLLTLAVFSMLTACTSIGPKLIRIDREQYNIIVKKTDEEQLLLNIVRLHYLEAPYFLQVNSIANSTSVTTNANASGSWTFPFVSRVFSATASASYSDSPTISYQPLENADFVQQILSPVNLKAIYLLSFGGSSEIGNLIRIAVKRVNDLDNASDASTPETRIAPTYKKFYYLLQQIGILFDKDLITFELETKEEVNHLLLHINKKGVLLKPALIIKKLLNVNLDAENIMLTSKFPPDPSKNQASVSTRSILGILSFLSHAIDIPEDDAIKRQIVVAKYPDGRPFDWSMLMKGLMSIHLANKRPKGAYVTCLYHHKWYYINDNDTSSKITFAILEQLIALSSGEQTSTGPVLTLPLG